VTPRGLGALVSMIAVGWLVRRVDNRVLVAVGFAILAASMWMLGRLNLEIAMRDVVWPNVIAGLAMGFIFVPLTNLAMAELDNRQISNATGIYNLVRNVGGSAGIAATTTLLARGAQAHQAALVRNVTPYDPEYQQWLAELTAALGAQSGPSTAAEQALQLLYGIVRQQAMLLAFIDNFRLIAALGLACIPLVLLFREVRRQQAAVAVH
jgi:DHA2 family multidrug resistance protein